MIAFHFPPLHGSSGIQRTLKFVRYLPEHGWQPIVLSASPRAYEKISNDQIDDIPPDIVVKRAFALDASRHFALGTRYPRFLALPDRWAPWVVGGVLSGLSLIRKHRPEVIFSTYPIASAHVIGLALHKLSGLPWIADFRDPMTDTDYPVDPVLRRIHTWLERTTFANCDRAVVTTPGTFEMYRTKYPALQDRLVEIQNGYDEENFAAAERRAWTKARERPVTLLHSGIMYPSERDPKSFIAALGDLKRKGKISTHSLRLIFRASGHDEFLRELLEKAGVDDIVELAPSIPYEAALSEMLEADGLLIFQAANCNLQIPAKLYEYLRARRPILAVTDPQGDTAATLRRVGVNTIVRIDSATDIAEGLVAFTELVGQKMAPIADQETVLGYSRRARSAELARLFDDVAGARVSPATFAS
jgi:glycosyltransferase involved in cell wall biosynthesis